MKLIIAVALLSMAMASQPPQPVARYETLGYDVIEYSDGSESFYEVFQKNGNIIVRANLLGFLQWKKETLLELIGSERISEPRREQYKLMYQEMVERETAFNTFAANYAAANAMERRARFAASTQRIIAESNERTRQIYAS